MLQRERPRASGCAPLSDAPSVLNRTNRLAALARQLRNDSPGGIEEANDRRAVPPDFDEYPGAPLRVFDREGDRTIDRSFHHQARFAARVGREKIPPLALRQTQQIGDGPVRTVDESNLGARAGSVLNRTDTEGLILVVAVEAEVPVGGHRTVGVLMPPPKIGPPFSVPSSL